MAKLAGAAGFDPSLVERRPPARTLADLVGEDDPAFQRLAEISTANQPSA